MKKLFSSTIFKLIIAVIIGILLGFVANEGFMNFVVTVKYILGQLIFFMVPLIILGFVSYSIAKMKDNASKMLSLALIIAYLSSIGAAFFFEMAPARTYRKESHTNWEMMTITITPRNTGSCFVMAPS